MTVKQVDIFLDLMEAFEEGRRPLTLTQLSERLRQPKSSTFNLIETLKARGYLYEVRQRGGFYPSRKFHDLMVGIAEGDPILQQLHDHLVDLTRETGETTLLAVRDRNEIIYIDVVESKQPIRYFASTGDRRPLYATSGGKAILSTYDPERREREAQALEFRDLRPTTIRDAAHLLQDIEAGLKRGWFVNASEFTPDVSGVGLPLVVDGRRMALSVAGPNYRFTERHAEAAKAIKAHIETIQQSLKEAGLS